MKKRELIVTASFEKSLKRLAKKYPSLKKIFQQALNELETTPGIGDEIQGHQSFYKVRYPNPDAGKGKSGGFRLIYFWSEENDLIVLVNIYAKTQQQDVDWHMVKRALEELENGRS
ncbi:type II toxin-antitoxin system RelE/ParE family toxin [candidate division CSSED10-310 bacterium]|uniref:Type II toxin-antitoxin system RelE/ParE family toxin n=1 Tax=candidate division CSSED10-310 bacterium TaxID=2855610 RepID=A0ABV6YVZ8_UNCC1